MNRLSRFRILLAVIGLLATLPLRAQLTLEECCRLAYDNYPLLKQYRLIEETTEFTIKNISRGYLPQLTLSGQATLQSDVTALPGALEDFMARAGGSKPKGLKKDQYRLSLDLSQAIYDGGSISAQRKVAEAGGDAEKAQIDVNLYEVRNRVNNLFFGVMLLNERLALNEDLQRLLKANGEKLQTMLSNGIAIEADVDMVRAEYLNVCQQHTELLSMREAYRQMLALFIGKPTDEVKDLQKPAEISLHTTGNNRPELQLFDARLRQNAAQENLLKSALRPRINLFAQGFYGYPSYNMFEDMFSNKFSWNGMFGVRLTWNISSLYTHKNEHQKLSTARHLIETQRETFLFNNNLLATQENANITRYRKLMQEDDEIITLRTSIRKAAEAKLENGIIDVNNLLQEITRENQAKTNRSSHEIEMLKHMYELKFVTNN